jgi:hypothetical protein
MKELKIMIMNKRVHNLQKQNIYPEENKVHVWNFDLDKINTQKNQLEPLLSMDELTMVSKFHFEIDKHRFICSQ